MVDYGNQNCKIIHEPSEAYVALYSCTESAIQTASMSRIDG